MKRPFLFPASAALIGVLMALGVFALKRTAQNALSNQHFYADVQVRTQAFDQIEATLEEVNEARLEAEVAREVVERVRRELQASLSSERDLSAAQRERIRQALERLEIEFAPGAFEVDVPSGNEAVDVAEPTEPGGDEPAAVRENDGTPDGSAGPPVGSAN